MAMIQCPECGKEISDKAKKCIHCGKILIEEQPEVIKCSECGAVLSSTDTECPNCGCPVEKNTEEVTKPQQVEVAGVKMARKTKGIIAAVVIVLVLCVVGVLVIKRTQTKKQSKST